MTSILPFGLSSSGLLVLRNTKNLKFHSRVVNMSWIFHEFASLMSKVCLCFSLRSLLLCRHEIVGLVTAVGTSVHRFNVGDRVGVGVIVGSCQTCDICEQSLESYCLKVMFTYNSTYHDGTRTYGGYSDMIVVHQRFVLQFPENLPSDAGAPLLCAGITVYSPMKYYGMTEPGKHLGVAGLGGLGHVAVKIGKAFGLKVTVISTSPKKEDEAIKKLGADAFVLSSDPTKMKVSAKINKKENFKIQNR